MAVWPIELNGLLPPNYENDSTEITMKCYVWGKCVSEPDVHYEGGELRIFDHVEVSGISLFEMDRMLEEQVRAYGEKKYYILIEEYGFRLLKHDRELHAYCTDHFEYGRVVDLFIEVSFRELIDSQWGSDIDDDDFVLEDQDDESDDEYEVSSGSGSGYFSEKESDYDQNSDDDDYDENVDQTSEWLGVENQKEEQLRKDARERIVIQSRKQIAADSDSEIDNSDIDAAPESGSDLESLQGSDKETLERLLMYNPKDANNPKLQVRQTFSNFLELKDAIRTWNIRRGRPYKFMKSDKLRVRAKCPNDGCDWCIYARKMKGTGTLEIRTFQEKHRCGFSYHNKSVKSGWVGKRYVEAFRQNPRLDYASFKKMVMKENKCFLSKDQAYRAKKIASALAKGSEVDHYNKLPKYINEIKRSNPGSTVILKLVDDYRDAVTKQRKFERLYMCYAGVKKGFLAACRPVFGLDGTFLKGSAGGVLLTAVGVDPNNGLYPIAFAATEGETKESWIWFLTLLKEDLQIVRDYEWTIMSDKQKGIIQACDIVFPNADHRFCVKHLHSNWSVAGFKGAALRQALWRAAKATIMPQFIRRIEEIAELDIEAAKWLDEKNPTEWSRSHFRTFPKCDLLLNNICESFNSKILDAREEPIVGMMESLRHFIMSRMQENRDRAQERWSKHKFCPKIRKRIGANIELATHCVPHKANDIHYEVMCPYGETFAVNIEKRSCSCRKWDLTGIPCYHSISAIWAAMKDPMDYIDDCYTVDAYLKCYEGCILPVNGEHEWMDVNVNPPLPPSYGRAPGRPKKQRRKSADEVQATKETRKKARRFGQICKCSYCGDRGHNTRTCKLKKEGVAVASQSCETGRETQPTEGENHSQGGDGLFDIECAATLSQIDADSFMENIPVRSISCNANEAPRKQAKRTNVIRVDFPFFLIPFLKFYNVFLNCYLLVIFQLVSAFSLQGSTSKGGVRKARLQTQKKVDANVDNIIASAPIAQQNLREIFGLPTCNVEYNSQPNPPPFADLRNPYKSSHGNSSRKGARKASKNKVDAVKHNMEASAFASQQFHGEILGLPPRNQEHINLPNLAASTTPFRIRDVHIHLGVKK